MDIKAKVAEIAAEMSKNPELLKEFKAKPAETVKNFVNIDLPEDALNAIVTGLKSKLSIEKLGSIGKLFGK